MKRLLTFALISTLYCLVCAAVPAQTARDRGPAPPAAARRPNPLLGCWQSTTKPTRMVRFEPKLRILADKDPDLFVVMVVKKYEKDRIIVAMMGQQIPIAFAIQGDILTQGDKQGNKHEYRRMDKTPPELELKAMPLGKAAALPPEKIKEIQQELAKREAADQDVRKDMKDVQRFETEGRKVDAENTKYIKSLVAAIGWIDCQRFGERAANAAFLLVQHSADLRLMMAALPEIEKDVKAKRLDGQAYALLYDRLKVSLGEKQRYGTQMGGNEKGQIVVFAMEDRSKVDEFRKELGIFPLAQYLAMVKQMTGVKEVVYEEP
jgi:hypothetical protein